MITNRPIKGNFHKSSVKSENKFFDIPKDLLRDLQSASTPVFQGLSVPGMQEMLYRENFPLLTGFYLNMLFYNQLSLFCINTKMRTTLKLIEKTCCIEVKNY